MGDQIWLLYFGVTIIRWVIRYGCRSSHLYNQTSLHMEKTLRLNNQPEGSAMEGLPLTSLVHLSQTPQVKVSLSFLYPTRMDGLFALVLSLVPSQGNAPNTWKKKKSFEFCSLRKMNQ
jgi:hypothetical protein